MVLAMQKLYKNQVFAPLDDDNVLLRVAGGNETEVYRSDDERYVVKLKHDQGGDTAALVAQAQHMRDIANEFVQCLGPKYSIPSHVLLSEDDQGETRILVVQPFLENAHSLHDVNLLALPVAQRWQIILQLREIIARSLRHYAKYGRMPDLYGRASTSEQERKRLNKPWMLPWRIWSFVVQRNLLKSHNLMLHFDPEPRLVLVDYDPVRRSTLYQQVYYATRWLLFWRDRIVMEWTLQQPE